MSFVQTKRAVSLIGALAALATLGIVVTALVPVVTPTPAVDPTVVEFGPNLEPVDAACDGSELDVNGAGPGCKACKDRPWCGCSYNGLPRVSCNPCCYGSGGNYTCLD